MKKRMLAGLAIAAMLAAYAPGVTAAGGENNTETPAPLTVELFERDNLAANDNGKKFWMDYLKSKALNELNIDLEFAICPRAEETSKLNVWMASMSAPDIMYTYNFDVMYSYAEMGALVDLSDYVTNDMYGVAELYSGALEYGQYDGRQYAIPQIVPDWNSDSTFFYVRQDWLDALDMSAPTSIGELYTMLRRFKDEDPGGIGSENVVPFAIPAPGVQGAQGFYLDVLVMFGVKFDGPYIKCLPTGNYDDGKFSSPVDNVFARAGYRYLNKLYKEGLIDAKFAIDINGARYDEQVYSGRAGLVDVNAQTPGSVNSLNSLTRENVPDANWVPVEPIKNPFNKKIVQGSRKVGKLNMIPSFSQNADTAIKYLAWQAGSDITKQLGYCINDAADNSDETLEFSTLERDIGRGWINNDLCLGKNFECWVSLDKLSEMYPGDEGERFAQAMGWAQQYGAEIVTMNEPRTVALKNASALEDYMFRGAAKVIVAENFEAEYDAYIDGWKAIGGAEYDAEITKVLNDRLSK